MTSKHKIDPPALVEDTGDVIHPGSMIRDQLAEAGYSVNAAAAAMALNRANLNNVVLGKVAVTRDLAYRLSALLNPDDADMDFARLLVDWQARYDWHRDAPSRKTLLSVMQASRRTIDARGKKAIDEVEAS